MVSAAKKPIPLREASLLVAITSHDAPRRLPYLMEVVRTLADFPVRRLDIEVFVNDIGEANATSLVRLLGLTLGRGRTCKVALCRDLGDPFMLAWQHKRLIPGRFLADGSPYTHFVYLEDDMRFGLANLRYFLRARPLLAPHRLIPSFLRVEYSAAMIELRLTDVPYRTLPAAAAGVEVGGRRFVVPPNPYSALYVLDRPLARSHVRGDAFDPQRSMGQSDWQTRERAAAGETFADPPAGFRTRMVLPLSADGTMYETDCWVPHLGNSYADSPDPYGKVPADTPFGRDARPAT